MNRYHNYGLIEKSSRLFTYIDNKTCLIGGPGK